MPLERLARVDPATIHDISGSFVDSPSTIAPGSTFTVQVSNSGEELTLDIRAELAHSNRGRTEISEIVARHFTSGESRPVDFIISDAELSGVQDGSYTLEIIAEATFESGSILIAATPVTVGEGGNGGNGPSVSDFSLSNCTMSPSTIGPGESVELRVDVTNDGQVPAPPRVAWQFGPRIWQAWTDYDLQPGDTHDALGTNADYGTLVDDVGSGDHNAEVSLVGFGPP